MRSGADSALRLQKLTGPPTLGRRPGPRLNLIRVNAGLAVR